MFFFCCDYRCEILEFVQICDILKGVILVFCFFIVNYIDIFMMYYFVRGQVVIKFYVFYNIKFDDCLFFDKMIYYGGINIIYNKKIKYQNYFFQNIINLGRF